ncbi:unnamed protein product [Clonostachys chloroleuca]|uniref:Uncharacterized protein n=1 Tax=Clonostachys chloroleuca TaxID=1926264 RepID=A0AA35M195_9HYPO|nr:unnamed protein product [Clonostachys chloroleuca]
MLRRAHLIAIGHTPPRNEAGLSAAANDDAGQPLVQASQAIAAALMERSQLLKSLRDLSAEKQEKDVVIENQRATFQSQHQHWELRQTSWEKERVSLLFLQRRNSGLEQDNYQLRVQAQKDDEEKRELREKKESLQHDYEEGRRRIAALSGQLEAKDNQLKQRTAELNLMENKYMSVTQELKLQASEVAHLTSINAQLKADLRSKDTELKSTMQGLAIQSNEVERLNKRFDKLEDTKS